MGAAKKLVKSVTKVVKKSFTGAADLIGGVVGALTGAGSTGGSSQSAFAMDTPQIGQGLVDKTSIQTADFMDAPELGDDESRKRKKRAGKAKFKVKKAKAPKTTGLNVGSATKSTGAQI